MAVCPDTPPAFASAAVLNTEILNDGGTIVLMSHLGRPKGERNDKYSLRHIVGEVEKVLGKKVIFVEDCVGEVAEKAVAAAPAGSVILLENLRYHKEEEKGDEGFSKELAKLGDIYVNDAFGTAHRAHASTTIVAKFFPESKCFGYLLAKEIESIDKVMKSGVGQHGQMAQTAHAHHGFRIEAVPIKSNYELPSGLKVALVRDDSAVLSIVSRETMN